MELSDSHKISQEKRDFKISDVLITAWSRVQVLAGPERKGTPRGAFSLYSGPPGLEQHGTAMGGANNSPVGCCLVRGSQRIGMSKSVGCRSEGRQDLNSTAPPWAGQTTAQWAVV